MQPAAAADQSLFSFLSAEPDIDFRVLFSYEWDAGRGRAADGSFCAEVLPGRELWRDEDRAMKVVLNTGLSKTLARLAPDVLLVGGYGHLAGLQAIVWALKRDVPWVLLSDSWIKGSRTRWRVKRILIAPLVSRAAAAVTFGNRGQSYLRSLGLRGPVIVAGSNRDLSTLALATDEARRLRTPSSPLTFGYVGRLVSEKGIDVLVDSFRLLAKETSCRLVVAGDGPYAARVASAQRQGLYVDYRGAVPFAEISSVYSDIDVLVLPSRREQWGMVVPEAMAAGVPVIATDRVGATETFVREGRTGWVVRGEDVESLADAMRKAVQVDVAGMGREARSLALTHDVRAVAKNLGLLLHRLARPMRQPR